jgi:Mg2+ and Co2+ transporter CorA
MTNPLLPVDWAVPAPFKERLGTNVGRQRLMLHDNNLLLILHNVPEAEQLEREGCFFWRNAEGGWKSSHYGEGIESLNKHIDQFTDKLEYYDQQEQHAKQAKEYFEILNGMAPLYRSIGPLHQVLHQARQACPKDRNLISIRDRSYDLERTAELFFNGTRSALEFLVAWRTEQQSFDSHSMAVSAHRLNVLAAFFFPLSILSSLFGGSYKDVMEGTFPGWSFGAIVITSILCGVILTKLLSHKDEPT